MNAIELKFKRKALFLTVEECSEKIAKVQIRTWLRWEKGLNKPNLRTKLMFNRLVNFRRKIINDLNNIPYKEIFIYENSYQFECETGKDQIYYKVYNSAISQILIDRTPNL